MTDCFVISVHHTLREHRYITVWRPDDRGYAYPLSWAGRYPRERIMQHLDGYYNDGCRNVSVSCEVLEQLAVDPRKGDIDGDVGPVVLNTRDNWKIILANLVATPPHKPEPTYKGARKRDWE
jgi:hypothetical protein